MRHSQLAPPKSWFVRECRGGGCNLRPSSRAGWLLTGLYALFMGAFALLLTLRDEPRAIEIAVWGIISVAMTVTFLLIAWRTSSPVVAESKSALGGRSRDPKARRSLIVALLTGAGIIGAALLGIGE